MVCIEKKNVTSSNIMSWNLKHFITNVKYLIIYLRLWICFLKISAEFSLFLLVPSYRQHFYYMSLQFPSWSNHPGSHLIHQTISYIFFMKMSHYLTKQQLNHHRTMKIKNTTLRIRNISMWWQTYLTNNLQ
jgi:hypothetical protein